MARRKKRKQRLVGYRRRPFRLKLKKQTLFSIGSVALVSAAALVVLSFSRQGELLERIYQVGVAWLGWGILFLPFVLAAAGLMLTRLKWRLTQPNIFLGSSLLLLSLLALTRSGFLGANLWQLVANQVTGLGAFVIVAGTAVVGFVVLFNTSLDEVLLKVSQVGVALVKVFPRGLPRPKPKLAEEKPPIQVRGPELAKAEPAPGKATVGEESQGLGEALVSNVPGASDTVWQPLPISLLSDHEAGKADRGDIKQNAAIIEKTLESFGIQARVAEVNLGPAVTQYALEIALGTKLSKITVLSSDLALALAAPRGQIRIEAPIPGRSLVGVEIPNRSLELVGLKDMLTAEQMKKAKSKLTVGLGLDVSGQAVIDDIGRMPHVLIAGATGSGKSVCINSFIGALLFRNSPSEVKLILIDPKRVELTQYNGIPHLLTPVITDTEKVISALKWAISEMDRRYKLFSQAGTRNIESYNELAGFQALPYIVIFIDELADIILFAPAEVEDTITRIAQMARATGIHLIVSTQRPSVDVITGLIKANIPCRIAFNVTSMVDSRVILDMPGAEKLLGRGDMLYIPPDQAKPTRIQGAFVSDKETGNIIDWLKKTGVRPEYTEEVTEMPRGAWVRPRRGETAEGLDEFFEDAVRTVCQYDRASASLLQRRLSIGYARAARILDQLERAGVVGPAEASKPRDVLTRNPDEFLASLKSGT